MLREHYMRDVKWMVAERCTRCTTRTVRPQHLRMMRRWPDIKHCEQTLFGGAWPVLHTENMLLRTWDPVQVLRQQLAH